MVKNYSSTEELFNLLAFVLRNNSSQWLLKEISIDKFTTKSTKTFCLPLKVTLAILSPFWGALTNCLTKTCRDMAQVGDCPQLFSFLYIIKTFRGKRSDEFSRVPFSKIEFKLIKLSLEFQILKSSAPFSEHQYDFHLVINF